MKINEIFNQTKVDRIKQNIIEIYRKRSSPPGAEYLKVIEDANNVLTCENPDIRPPDSGKLPGGIIRLKKNIPTIIVPDLHARVKFIINLLSFTDTAGMSVLQKLAFNQIQIVCIGDGFHSEHGTRERWKAAYKEFTSGFHSSKHMDQEMGNSMRLMEIVMVLKSAYPENFHFLKGNHENICNESDNGNHAFRKFAWESLMVYEYMKKFYDSKMIDAFYKFEKNLPLLAIGRNFLISHAEPKKFYGTASLTDYRQHPEIIEGLTWTADDDAQKNSVDRMLKYYLDSSNPKEKRYYFGGHRSIKTIYNLRADGKFVQIHNPAKYIIAFIDPEKEIDLEQDIIVLDNNINKTFTMKSFIDQKILKKVTKKAAWKRK